MSSSFFHKNSKKRKKIKIDLTPGGLSLGSPCREGECVMSCLCCIIGCFCPYQSLHYMNYNLHLFASSLYSDNNVSYICVNRGRRCFSDRGDHPSSYREIPYVCFQGRGCRRRMAASQAVRHKRVSEKQLLRFWNCSLTSDNCGRTGLFRQA